MNFMSELCSDLTYKLQFPLFDNIKNRLLLANHSIKQLNIISKDGNNQYASIHNLINKCSTPMGKRYLKDKLLHPTTDTKYLNSEYDIIEHFVNNWEKHSHLRTTLKNKVILNIYTEKLFLKKFIPMNLVNFTKISL